MPHFHFPSQERSRCAGSVFAPVASLTAPQAAILGISLEGPQWPETLLATCHL
jgi:hypothetical protein